MPRAATARPKQIVDLPDADESLREIIARHDADPDFWSSKERDRSDSAHCIFQYPAMMVPLVQRRLLAAVREAQPQALSLYDPFAGSGTSLVSGMHYGLDVYGNDVNPLAVLISRTRTASKFEFDIGPIATSVVAAARDDGRQRIETKLSNRDKWFKDDVALELSRLCRAIRKCRNEWVRRFLWVTLAETVRLTSNDRTSTYKLHARPQAEINARQLSPIDIFADLAIQNAKSFTAFQSALRRAKVIERGRYIASSDVRIGDTRQLDQIAGWPPPGGFNMVMTSPPYGDNLTTVTYGQHAYLPLHWIDLADIDPTVDADTIRTTQEIDRRGLGGRHRKDLVAREEELFAATPSLRRFADALPASPKDARTRLLRFYVDFRETLSALTPALSANGYMIWTVGNRSLANRQVPTDEVLRELLDSHGCSLVTTLTRKIHHKRMAVRNASSSTMREEHIILVRKNGD
jgi:hypothetical protein